MRCFASWRGWGWVQLVGWRPALATETTNAPPTNRNIHRTHSLPRNRRPRERCTRRCGAPWCSHPDDLFLVGGDERWPSRRRRQRRWRCRWQRLFRCPTLPAAVLWPPQRWDPSRLTGWRLDVRSIGQRDLVREHRTRLRPGVGGECHCIELDPERKSNICFI